jgi:hypothetical protein
MTAPPFAVELAIVALLLVAIAAWVLRFAFYARGAGAPPVIRASLRKLKTGWYQVSMTVTNRAPYALLGVSLRRVRPNAARLLAPIIAVNTKEGDFQVWSDPAIDKATTTIPLDLVVGPREHPHGVVSLRSEAQAAAWLFLPEGTAPEPVTLELTLREDGDKLRRHRFDVTPEAGP